MIQGLANRITKYMFEMNMCSEKFEVHCYGIEVMISTVIDFMLIIGIGLVMHRFLESIIYYFSFWIIRKFSGGYHCQTYFHCISLHVILFVFYLLTYQIYNHLMIYIQMFALMVFIFLSPIRNRKLNNKEYKKYKEISIIILICFMGLSYMNYYSYILTYVILVVTILMIACIKKYEIKTY